MNVVIRVLYKSHNTTKTTWKHPGFSQSQGHKSLSQGTNSLGILLCTGKECGVTGRSELLILVWSKSRHL